MWMLNFCLLPGLRGFPAKILYAFLVLNHPSSSSSPLWSPRFHYANSTRWFREVSLWNFLNFASTLSFLGPNISLSSLFSSLFHRSNIPRIITTLICSWIIKKHVIFLDYLSFTGKGYSSSDSAMQSRPKVTGRLPTTSSSRRSKKTFCYIFSTKVDSC